MKQGFLNLKIDVMMQFPLFQPYINADSTDRNKTEKEFFEKLKSTSADQKSLIKESFNKTNFTPIKKISTTEVQVPFVLTSYKPRCFSPKFDIVWIL